MSIRVIGHELVEENLKRLGDELSPEVIEQELLQGAQIIAQAAINKAPAGPTLNLKRGIIAKVLQRKEPGKAAPAMAAIDFRIAPHADLVEFGTGERIALKGSRKRLGKSSGVMPARPFMRPAWDENAVAVKDAIIADFWRMLEDAVKK